MNKMNFLFFIIFILGLSVISYNFLTVTKEEPIKHFKENKVIIK